jgi:hypothetical protein
MVAFVACEYTHTIDQIKQKTNKKNYLDLCYLSLVATVFFLPPYFSHTHTQAFLSFGIGDVMELHDVTN